MNIELPYIIGSTSSVILLRDRIDHVYGLPDNFGTIHLVDLIINPTDPTQSALELDEISIDIYHSIMEVIHDKISDGTATSDDRLIYSIQSPQHMAKIWDLDATVH